MNDYDGPNLCNQKLKADGKTYPRTCRFCGLGPCAFPQDEKYAAIITHTIHHPGDERSRTNPGHGYPAYDETVENLHKFKSKQDMLDWVEARYDSKYTLIKYTELRVTTKIEISS